MTTLHDVLQIAQPLLRGQDITPALIAEKVDIAAGLMPGGSEVRREAIAELIRRFSHWMGREMVLADSTNHEAWLVAGLKRDWRYWPRYQTLLERKMSIQVVETLDGITDRILGLLENPLRKGNWDRRGLVVGHVQSGKTSNYTGLICKAADAGYKIIIVLAGLHNNLRSQTQIRLEEGFLGYKTGDAAVSTGVGEIDPSIRTDCATTRAGNGDFNVRVARNYAIRPDQRPWLFVIKKNKTVLTNLLRWLHNHVADTKSEDGRPLIARLPLLLIDDEADHASVDTGEQLFDANGKPDMEHEPRTINRLIRRILHSFTRKAYVGYTATPFANIFIHRQAETSSEGPDVFPQAFIINLPAPSNYVGPTRLFGMRSHDGRSSGLPCIREVCDHRDEEKTGGWMPHTHRNGHVPLHKGKDEVPPSLREAVSVFILACAVRNWRGQGRNHCSMLIHVTRYVAVQAEVHRQVEELVRRFRQRIQRGLDQELLLEWQSLWERDFSATSSQVARILAGQEEEFRLPDWKEIVGILPDILGDISVRKINGTAKDALDYADNEDIGLKVIAIGGDRLARGLTLEGLCVSYFVRTSRMYDTLMQMGRWFGYRPGYIDLCRLYTTGDLIEWFGHIADASEELRQEFDTMAAIGATPREYGLKVQSHPVLMVTSPLKMRTARTLQLSFSGEVLETIAFHREREILDRNLRATERLLEVAGNPSCSGEIIRQWGNMKQEWKGFLWEGVHADHVTDFLGSYVTHPAARKVKSTLLSEFIRIMADSGELTSWTIALIGGGEGNSHRFCGQYLLERTIQRKPKEDVEHYSIGRLLSPRDEAIDLDEAAFCAALEITRIARVDDPARQTGTGRPEPPKLPGGPIIRRVRGLGYSGVAPHPERGLLLLYPLDPAFAKMPEGSPPVMAFGISFPSSHQNKTVDYEVDQLLWESEYGQAD